MSGGFRRFALAGVLGASLLGAGAASDGARAMPVAPAAAVSADAPLEAVRYRHHRERVRHHYYGHHRRGYAPGTRYTRRFDGYQGPAGLYDCGRQLNRTRLGRKACY